jgi:hypothetical protein
LSLGKKHTVYKKAGMSKRQRFHIDMFADAKQILMDGETVYDVDKGGFLDLIELTRASKSSI